MQGYSGTPLAKKLGFTKEGLRIRIENAPSSYLELIDQLPESTVISTRIRKHVDAWHLFTTSHSDLARKLPVLMAAIRPDGIIWISWPKKSSGVSSSVTEDTIREIALPLGLVDVKVCAVDETWSGLKLVIRKELRQ